MTTSIEELISETSVVVAGKEYDLPIAEYLAVDPSHLEHEFTVHTQRVAIVGFAYEKALIHVQKLETQLGRMYALCDAKVRINLTFDLGNKKPTEAMVENAVRVEPEYQELENELLSAKEHLGVLRVLKDAMAHRKDVLVGLAANYRSEIQADRMMIRS